MPGLPAKAAHQGGRYPVKFTNCAPIYGTSSPKKSCRMDMFFWVLIQLMKKAGVGPCVIKIFSAVFTATTILILVVLVSNGHAY